MTDICESDQKHLLKVARKSIRARLTNQNYTPPEYPPLAGFENGLFVTLYCNDELRGCLGRFDPEGVAICDLTAKLATETALHDFRFVPITLEEMPWLDIHISLLTVPQIIGSINDIEIGKHGLKIEKLNGSGNHKTGTLLPQVASERNWNREEFLIHTCQKAGLAGNAWEKDDVRIYTYEARVFADHDFQTPPYE